VPQIKSKQQLEVDERYAAIGCPADLSEATFGVEAPGAGSAVVGVEANGVTWPSSRGRFGLLEQVSPDALALSVRVDRHIRQIESSPNVLEVCGVDRPGLFGGEPQRSNDIGVVPGHQDTRRPDPAKYTRFSDSGGPVADPMPASQVFGDRIPKTSNRDCVSIDRGGHSQSHLAKQK
jgi:hypothetical protein